MPHSIKENVENKKIDLNNFQIMIDDRQGLYLNQMSLI